MKKPFLVFLFLGVFTNVWAQIPPGYYDPVDSLYGDTLRFELSKIIDNHQVQSYSSLWNHFWETDRKADSTVWDIYSDVPGGTPPYIFEFYTDQCGNYSGEGDCYNREHSFPRSWFNDQSPMNTDLFHLFPTDGYVNGQRGNLPYGETNNPSWTSQNGSKRGSSSVSGYSGNVFEPLDEYKGDFARAYFYMVTRYYNQVSNWTSDMLDGNDYDEWAADMLLEWHREDTVGPKELDRNEAIFNVQQNRNPFVDHPAYVELIWGDSVIIGDTSTTTFLNTDRVNKPFLSYYNDEFQMSNIESYEEYLLQVFDVTGRKEFSKMVKPGQRFRHQLKSGLYFIIINGDQLRRYQKIGVKE